MSPSVRCPMCGADLPIRSPATVLVVCAYCSSVAYVQADVATSAGVASSLVEGFTRLYRGAVGVLGGERFEVVGRARFAHLRGFWDEWFVAVLPNRTAWVTEDDHELAVQTPASAHDFGFATSLRPGQRFDFQGRTFEVDEVGEAECVGIEGELPVGLRPGARFRYVDATTLDGGAALGIELDGERSGVYLGRFLEHEDVRLDDEGDAW